MKKIIITTALTLAPLITHPQAPKLRYNEMKCLTDNLYYEARGEPLKGQLMVARATLNRAKPYGSICTAVYEPYQFSWTMMPKKPKINKELYAKMEKVAYMALYYNSPVYYFHNKQVKPAWASTKTRIASIGNHIYYH